MRFDGRLWDRPHPGLGGVVPVGLTYPSANRAIRNSYWLLARPGAIEPAGWGDLSLDDLVRIADHLPAGGVLFIALRESAVTSGILDWDGSPGSAPRLAVIADFTLWIAGLAGVVRITPDGTNASWLAISPAQLVGVLERLTGLPGRWRPEGERLHG